MEELAKVAVLENEVEAQMLDAILSDRDIPHVMRTYHDGAYDGVFQASSGWGLVLAPPSHHHEILKILEELRSGEEPPEALIP